VVLGAALASGLVGSFPRGFFWTVFGAASSLGAGPGPELFAFARVVLNAELAAGSGALGVFSVFALRAAAFFAGFARFVNSKSPSLLS